MRTHQHDEHSRPPGILRTIIRLSLPAEDRESLSRDLEVLWAKRLRERGRSSANWWLARQAAGFALRVGAWRWLPDRHTLESLVADARVSLRTMRREPVFVLSFVLTLGISTGVLTAIYSAANWVLLRPVPGVRDAGALMTMRLNMRRQPERITWDISQPDLTTLRGRLSRLTELAAMTPIDVDVRERLELPRRIAAELITANYFGVLRARMAAGRGFTADDEVIGARGSVVLSYALARAMAVDPASVIGRDVHVNGAQLRVIGVAERGFRGAELPGRPMLWLPASALTVIDPTAGDTALSNRRFGVWRRLIGRLEPGATPAQVAVAANVVRRAVTAEFSVRSSYNATTFEFRAFPGVGLDEGVHALVQRTLGLLLGAAGFLLCLAIANLTNLALARCMARREAAAVRLALGASRARIVSGVFVETLMLGAAGGLAALSFATAWTRWFGGVQLSEVGGSLEGMHADARVAAFAMGASLIAAAIAFIRPALLTRRPPLEQLMRRDRAGAQGGALRTVLVGLQVALSMVLLVAALLLGRTVSNLRAIQLGFPIDGLTTAAANPQLHGYDHARLDYSMRELERRLRLEPGISAAGVISPAPLGSSYMTAGAGREDDDGEDESKRIAGAGYFVTPGFLEALGVSVLAGDRQWAADSGSVVLTREMLREVYPELSPARAIGRRVRLGQQQMARIAAVVENVQLSDLTNDPPPTIFRPLREVLVGAAVTVFVRTSSARANAPATVARVMADVDPDVPIYNVRSARALVDLQFAERRIMAVVASSLGALGIALAAIGLYGVLANVVAAEQREIAIRSALGATPRMILGRVFVRGFIPVVVGTVIGVAGAAGASRLLASQLFGLQALDPAVYAWGLAATLGLTLAACVPPAYRATRVSVVEMLRVD